MLVSHILVIDCGSTGIRTILVNSKSHIVYRDYKKIEILHPEDGATENSPTQIWETFKEIVQKALHTPLLKIDAIAITNQRSTFALWDRQSGVPLTNFINWQDVRAANTARRMNKNPIWLLLRTFAFIVGRVLKNPLLTVTSMLKLNTDHTICKLRWLLDNNKELEKRCFNSEVNFGTIDSWLLYKLTGNKVHGTDYTNAAATTLLNPFMMKWNTLFCKIFKLPMQILPTVYNTNETFGHTSKEIFGKEIPIKCLVGDQQASLFGHRCFNKGEAKISLGSGGFVSMNVGPKPKFSTKGLFPLIGWTLDKKPTYKLEGQVATVGTFIDWLINDMEMFKSPVELDSYASKCDNTQGVFVIPTLSGIRFPYFKPDLNASISGLSLKVSKPHLARAILEGIAHRVMDIIEGMESETKISIPNLKIDGGVSNSDVLMQMIADLSGKVVYRSTESDLASLGAAYFAGLSSGMFKSTKEILNIKIPNKRFNPNYSLERRVKERKLWRDHIKKSEKMFPA
ncbi:glycerol kinase [Thiospirochaeta perfilievii]|uniref:Glycerol kinase 5 n=1 Tax=Thiospirochaeta perfilievii TaxID=252967 RepID=A0A5C1QBC0_9SPIO|nr:glycerol kinase [Thiospirochaeta perfilievii]